MTLSVRNGLLAFGFSVLLLTALGYAFLSVTLLSSEGWSARIGPVSLTMLLLEAASALGASLAGFILMRRAHRKSAAPELFFFALFFAALAGEGLLVVQAWLHYQGAAAWFSSSLTRIVWACRFSALFLLFCGSLFAFDFPYRKYGNLVAGSIAVSVFLAWSLPLHTSSARNHLLFAIGDTPGVVLFTALIAVVTALNFLLGSKQPGASDQAGARALASVFLLMGWGLAIITAPWGALLVVPGIVLAGWNVKQTAFH